jgi:hypothetical protein
MNAKVDGVEVYLKENPAFSFSFFDFIDPTKVKGATATTIEILATQEAEAVMGSRNMAELPARREHVLEVGPGYWKGRIVVTERADDVIRCESVAGNGGWIARSKDLRLRALKMGTSEVVTAEYQRETWTDDADPVYFPLIDYGSFEGQNNTFNVTALKLRPGIRVWTVLQQAFNEMGFSLRATGRLNAIWRKLVMPNTHDNIRSLGCFATSGDASTAATLTPQVYTAPNLNGTPPPVPFGVVVSDPNGNFPGLGATYVMPVSTDQILQVSLCRFGIAFDPFSDQGRTVRVVLWDTVDGELDGVNVALTSPNGLQQFTHAFGQKVVPVGRTLYIGIQSTDGNPITVSVPQALAEVSYDPNPPEELIQYVPYTIGERLLIASLNPDWTVADLVKNLTAMLCLTWRTDDSTGRVTVAHWDDTLRPSINGIDFRGRENQAYPVKRTPLAPSSFFFRYSPDAKDRLLQTLVSTAPEPGYGNADRVVPFGTERPEEIELDFAATAMGRILGALFVPIMRKEEGTVGVDHYEYDPRILLADGVITAPNTWRHASDTLTVQPKCYFIYPGETRYGLAFGRETIYGQASPGLVEQHYRERIARLGTAYLLDIDLRLDDDELLQFDFTRPVFVDDGFGGGWYYIINVEQKQFNTDAFTRCTLLQA